MAINIYYKNFQDFDFQLLRSFCYASDFNLTYGYALSTAQRIPEGDFKGWYTEWLATGDRLKQIADNSLSKSHIISARDFYFKAAICYRTADFFIRQNLDDARLIPLADKQRESFREGCKLLEYKTTPLNIPYENTTLDGYLFEVDNTGKKRPALTYVGGYDGFVEETFFFGAYEALKRGYNVLAFDGPGQGQVLRRQKLYFRPDWENVVTPVIDYAYSFDCIDKEKIILYGRSFAGYLVPRAACFEKRICALVADAVLYDLGIGVKEKMGNLYNDIVTGNDAALKPVFDKIFEDKEKKFYFESRMSVHGAMTPMEYLRLLIDYSVKGIAKNIKVPAYICAAELDEISVSQIGLLDAELNCKKKSVIFKDSDGAGDHCEIANQSLFYQDSFDWLDEIVGRKD